MAAKIGCQTCLISVSDDDNLYLVGHSDKPGEYLDRLIASRDTICSLTKRMKTPLRISSVDTVPALRDLPVIKSCGVVAYIGVPLILEDGVSVGALCCLSDVPRVWSKQEQAYLEDAAQIASGQIELKRVKVENRDLDGTVREFDRILAALSQGRSAPCSVHDEGGEFLFSNQALARDLGLNAAELNALPQALFQALAGGNHQLPRDLQVNIDLPGGTVRSLRARCERTGAGVMLCEWNAA